MGSIRRYIQWRKCGLDLKPYTGKLLFKWRVLSTLSGQSVSYVFRNVYPEQGWANRDAAVVASRNLIKILKENLPAPKTPKRENTVFEPLSYKDMFMSWIPTSTNIEKMRLYIKSLGSNEYKKKGKELPPNSQSFLYRMYQSSRMHRFKRACPDIGGKTAQSQDDFDRRRIVANVLGLAVMTYIDCAESMFFFIPPKSSESSADVVTQHALKL